MEQTEFQLRRNWATLWGEGSRWYFFRCDSLRSWSDAWLRVIRLLACDLDVFTGLTALRNLPGFFFGKDLTHGHSIDSFKTLSLTFSLAEAAGEHER